MAATRPSLKPRKTPVQARSQNTVEAIFEASIQVLLDGGLERLTTTRVAARAGVSVGSLYQYYPNKESLLAAVLERHLVGTVEAVEAACAGAKGLDVEAMARGVVEAFVSAKMQRPDASRALYAVAADLGGAAVVARLTQRAQLAVCDMLATAADARFDDLRLASYVFTTAVVGPVQGLLEGEAPPAMVEAVRDQLAGMLAAYLYRIARA